MPSPFDVAQKYIAKAKGTAPTAAPIVEPPAADQIIDETVIAVLIDSEILGHPIWFAFNDAWRPDEGDLTPVCYASELPALRTKTTEQLRSIFTSYKPIFGGGMVRR